ncbi:MAG: GH3 auxin-responsive promoter family protein [Nitrososphaeria archaeon]|nr:GH3 auxin-responsive promoter family protein [Nitrososphaeria archaeon]
MDLEIEKNLYNVLEPWYNSLNEPKNSQTKVLERLLESYSRTEYGVLHNASSNMTLEEFRQSFKIVTYQDLKPFLEKISYENFNVLLSEPPVGWVMTRGTTGKPKTFPITKTHLSQILLCGARSVANYALKRKKFEIFQGKALNLNFPSQIDVLKKGDSKISYGYSSGTYAKFNRSFAGLQLIPYQEEIDALKTDLSRRGWRARFQLVYDKVKDENISICIGVAPVILEFAKFVKQNYGLMPKDFWNVKAIFCTSVPKIHWNYAPILKRYYGNVDVIEIYSATEGVFGQQLDNLPYICPNYDMHLFEVITRKGVKMLYELKDGEWGKLVVSTSFLPRYYVGDLIECFGKQYFRVFGRDKILTKIEHYIHNLLTGRFI